MGFHGLSMKVSFCHFFLLTLLACSSKDDPWSSLHGLQCLLGTLVSISCRAISAPTPEAPPPLPCTVMLLPRGTVSHTFCLCYSVFFFCCCCGFDFLVFNFFFFWGGSCFLLLCCSSCCCCCHCCLYGILLFLKYDFQKNQQLH